MAVVVVLTETFELVVAVVVVVGHVGYFGAIVARSYHFAVAGIVALDAVFVAVALMRSPLCHLIVIVSFYCYH